MKNEKEIRRFFADKGMVVSKIRRSKHWVVRAGYDEQKTHIFVLSTSASDHRARMNLECEIKRAAATWDMI